MPVHVQLARRQLLSAYTGKNKDYDCRTIEDSALLSNQKGMDAV